MAELHKSRLFAQLENLPEQSRKRLQVPLAEVGDGAKIRVLLRPLSTRKATSVSQRAASLRELNTPLQYP